ncbi:ATP-binding protein [Paenibacillus aurantius]|uniref:histidine kinase n=1 Tax=Paenibacillus aurantius TaxID=2918900 RepID=A0AA96L967_9BACL|nr:ATP-binding protein [Paenibacillus aurantius]WNQ09322.1 ATP-binding protein [Paenibacillus aurantius]
MFILKSVVGKLWMTIIALVAVVLIILGLFLFRYIDTSFPKSNDQIATLKSLAGKIAGDAGIHRNDTNYVQAMKDLLHAQDAGILLIERKPENLHAELELPGGQKEKLSDILPPAELNTVMSGKTLAPVPFSSYTGDNTREDFLITAVPVTGNEQGASTHSLLLFQSKKSVENTQTYVKKLFALVSFIGFLLTTFFAFFLITRITRPLVELKKAADFITRGEYGTRVPVLSDDEIGDLTNTFNLMGDQLEETIKDLNHEKDNLSSVLRSMADAVISFDVEGKVIFTNPEGEKLLEDWAAIAWEDPEEGEERARRAPLIPMPLQQLFEQVVSDTREITSKIHVQSSVWSIIIAPLYSKDVIRGAVAVLRDVTEENRLEKLRKDFVANVSHELRTPLSMLQGYSEALIDDIAASPEERKELAQVIHDESLRMGRLVKDLLDLARMEAGHMELNFREVDLDPLLKRVHRKFYAYGKERGIRFELDMRTPGLHLHRADEDRLEQVMTNLLDNAVRHSPPDTAIIIRAEETEWKGRPAVSLEIEDQGQGIPAGDLPYIFERFYKADKARTRGSSGGTGLGLAIVKNIVDAHQGTIQARSTVGQGTTFSILLPVEGTPGSA